MRGQTCDCGSYEFLVCCLHEYWGSPVDGQSWDDVIKEAESAANDPSPARKTNNLVRKDLYRKVYQRCDARHEGVW